MSARPVLFAFSFAFVAGWMLDAPRTTKYRVETRVEQVVDLTGLGQQEQRHNLGLTSFLTITLDDTTGGQTVVFSTTRVNVRDRMTWPARRTSARNGTWTPSTER